MQQTAEESMEPLQAELLEEPNDIEDVELEESEIENQEIESGNPDHPDPCKVKPWDIRFWQYQNMMRTHPKAFIRFLEDYKTKFKGKIITLPDGTRLMTHEGPGAADALIQRLKSAKKLTPLKWNDALWKAAVYFVKEQGPTGQTGHVGPAPNHSTFVQRINMYMKWEATIGENVAYGAFTPLTAVTQLAQDDGQPSRGHYRNIMKSNFYYTGMATGMHKRFRDMTLTDFSGSYRPDKNWKAPTRMVPSKMSDDNEGIKWSDPPKCSFK